MVGKVSQTDHNELRQLHRSFCRTRYQEQAASILSGPDSLFLLRLLESCKEELPVFVNASDGARVHTIVNTEDLRVAILQRLVGTPESDVTGTDIRRKLLINRSFAIGYAGWTAARDSFLTSVKQFSPSRPSLTRP